MSASSVHGSGDWQSGVDVLVLAGGALEAERFQGLEPLVPYKAAVPVLGRPMFEWVVEAARSCPAVRRIRVITYPELASPRLEALSAELVPERGDIADNFRAGLDALPGSERVLVVSGDLPLLTRAALDDLLSGAPAAEVVFPYVERADVLREFPDREWVFSHTPEGAFTGSAVFLCRPPAVLAQWRWVEELLAARRKSPLQLALMFGVGFGLRLLLRRLRVRDVEARLSGLFHVTARGFRSRRSELAMDVDKYGDVLFVEARLRQRAE